MKIQSMAFISKHYRLCIVIGILLISAGAWAQGTTASPVADSSAYWRDVALGVLGVLLTIIGWLANSLNKRMKDLEAAHQNFKLEIAKEYHDSERVHQAIEQAVAPVLEKVGAIGEGVKNMQQQLNRLFQAKRPGMPTDDGI